MEEFKNLEELTKNISDKLLDSISMLEILRDIIDGEQKEDFLISNSLKNIKQSFNDIEKCRELISIPD